MGADEFEQFGEHTLRNADVLREEVIVVDVSGVGGQVVGIGFPSEVVDDGGRKGGHVAGLRMISSGGAAWGGGIGWWCPREINDS